MGTIWRNYSKDALCVIIMNLDSKPCRTKFAIDSSRFLKSATGKLYISRLTLNGACPVRTEKTGEITEEITLAAHEILIMTMR